MFLVVVSHVRGEQPASPAGDIVCVPGMHDEMNVIRHETGRDERNLHEFLRPADQCQESLKIGRVVKDLGAAIGTIQHVVVLIGKDESRRARHDGKIFVPSEKGLTSICRLSR